MSDSVLTSIKKVLGIEKDYEAFDADILMHINSAFATLTQLGVGPAGGVRVEDADTEWSSLIASDPNLSPVKSYVYLRVRLLFDPPTTPHALNAFEEQKKELEYRLNVYKEETIWVDHTPPKPLVEDVFADD